MRGKRLFEVHTMTWLHLHRFKRLVKFFTLIFIYLNGKPSTSKLTLDSKLRSRRSPIKDGHAWLSFEAKVRVTVFTRPSRFARAVCMKTVMHRKSKSAGILKLERFLFWSNLCFYLLFKKKDKILISVFLRKSFPIVNQSLPIPWNFN